MRRRWILSQLSTIVVSPTAAHWRDLSPSSSTPLALPLAPSPAPSLTNKRLFAGAAAGTRTLLQPSTANGRFENEDDFMWRPIPTEQYQPPSRELLLELMKTMHATEEATKPGAAPVAALSAKLTDEAIGELEEKGGLYMCLKFNPTLFRLQKVNNALCVSLNDGVMLWKGGIVDETVKLIQEILQHRAAAREEEGQPPARDEDDGWVSYDEIFNSMTPRQRKSIEIFAQKHLTSNFDHLPNHLLNQFFYGASRRPDAFEVNPQATHLRLLEIGREHPSNRGFKEVALQNVINSQRENAYRVLGLDPDTFLGGGGASRGLKVDPVHVLQLVGPFLPCGFFVPIVELVEHMVREENNFGSKVLQKIRQASRQIKFASSDFGEGEGNDTESEEDKESDQLEVDTKALFTVLESLPEALIDLRVLGDEKEDVFVRFIGEGWPCSTVSPSSSSGLERSSLKVEEKAHIRFAESYDVSAEIGQEVATALAAAGKVDPIRIDQLQEALQDNDALFEKLPALFRQGPALILAFDRLQHLFEVDFSAYTIRLRSADGCAHFDITDGGGGGTNGNSNNSTVPNFTLASTPDPLLVRSVMTFISESIDGKTGHTRSVNEIEDHVAEHNLSRGIFPGAKELVDTHPECLVYKDEKKRNAVQINPLGKWKQTATLYSASLVSSSTSTSASAFSSFNPATSTREVLLQRLLTIKEFFPEDRYIGTFHTFMNKLPRHLQLPPSTNFRFLFDQFPEHFTVLEFYDRPGWGVQRADLPIPLHCHRPCNTVDDLIREIATASIDRINEGSLNNKLSGPARKMIRAFGNLEQIVTQLPEWFEFFNRTGIPGQGFVKYIGHTQQVKQQRKVIKRKR